MRPNLCRRAAALAGFLSISLLALASGPSRAASADDGEIEALRAAVKELKAHAEKTSDDLLRAKHDAEVAKAEAKELRGTIDQLTKDLQDSQSRHSADVARLMKENEAVHGDLETLRVQSMRSELEVQRTKAGNEAKLEILTAAYAATPATTLVTVLTNFKDSEKHVWLTLAALAAHDDVAVASADAILDAAVTLTSASPIGTAAPDAVTIFSKWGAAALPALTSRLEKSPAEAGPTTWQALENLGTAAKPALPLLRRLGDLLGETNAEVRERAAKAVKVIEAAK